MNYKWVMRSVEDPGCIRQLGAALNDLPEALARSLVVRGVRTLEQAKIYFRPSLAQLHDPFLMADMDLAAKRLAQAVERGERVLVYGDYDVDGVTSTALMVHFLRDLGADVDYFIPHRTRDGYGLCISGVDHAKEVDADLIVALDCGVTAHGPATHAKGLGIDLVICDHHTSTGSLPDAVAVLDPKRDDCSYPFDGLSGCGVGFKLAQATLTVLGKTDEQLLELLDLVSLSIASDIVPIDGENRVLMREGLKRLTEHPRLGVQCLASVAGLDLSDCSTGQIVFGLAPRINAAGRLQDASIAVELLTETSRQRAMELARQLEDINNERRTIDQETIAEAGEIAQGMMDARSRSGLVLHNPAWHPGVIGITASRIVERFFRPTVMLTTVDGIAKGSARSIDGVNVYQALWDCRDLLIEFGGHDYAAGLRLEEHQVDEFRERFEQAVHKQLSPELLLPAIKIDAPVSLTDIDTRFWAVLKQFAPFGPHNSTPVFSAESIEVVGRPQAVGRTNKHLKFAVRPSGTTGPVLSAIAFGLGDRLDTLLESQRTGKPIEMAFSLQENRYRGRTSIQLRPRDVRFRS